MNICSVSECETPAHCRGYCPAHYHTEWQSKIDRPKCSVDMCDKKSFSTVGYCKAHYSRWKRHGDPLAGNNSRGTAKAWLDSHVGYGGDECLIYPYGKTGSGYGVFQENKKQVSAHRYMCERAHGAAPGRGSVSAHTCGNGHLGCVNPKHLRWATYSENSLDAVKHGTHPGLSMKGSKHPLSKVSEIEIRDIRTRVAHGESQNSVAERFGLSQSWVSRVCSDHAWQHV